ncbi:hypothetical protein HUW51_04200 [Adhaeribacter swui]|uniref:Uncharacterized protein n=1 Tax=Adhaeribacter swui TaxID=2086471 RepID=A0A7G7G480_9BACT|nr:hypothetical protein [Adhaeribacter swui]QNF31964.1 hypothetical protein HUW51_04200 [Adhaeribacter swui]
MIAADIFKKLRLFANQKKLIVNAPTEFLKLLADVAFDTHTDPLKTGTYDFITVFGVNQEELSQGLQAVSVAGIYDCLFWACYPKGTGKIKSDLKREVVWGLVDQHGLQCVSQIAINETWSALRARPAEAVGT